MRKNKDLEINIQSFTTFIKINRPPHNFFDADLISQIADVLEREMDSNNKCRSIILHSEGKNFVQVLILNNQILKRGEMYIQIYINKQLDYFRLRNL